MHARTVLRWGLIVVLIALGLWLLNIAAFNYWAAGGPPTPNPEAFRSRGNVMLGLSGLIFIAAFATFLVTRRRRIES